MHGIGPPTQAGGNVRMLRARTGGPRSREEERTIETGGGPPHPPQMDIGERLARVESGLDWIKVILTILGAFIIGGFSILFSQISRVDGNIQAQAQRLDAKIDTIPQRLSEEFRAMRAEMSAQTSAIANAITATRQAPAPAPQIIVIPTPQPSPTPAPEPPKR